MSTSLSGSTLLEPIFGRERELALLAAALESLTREGGQLVLLSGEAGIGKSLLIDHFLAVVGAQGGLTLKATCLDLGLSPPYGVWLGLFQAYNDRTASTDGPLAPIGLDGGQESAGIGSHGKLVDETTAFLTTLAARGPVIVALEDLQWADAASLELLHAAALDLGRAPVLLIASYRDIDVSPETPLYRHLPRLARGPRVMRLQLREISPEAIRALVTHSYGLPRGQAHQLSEWLQRYSGGIPFFVIELLYNLEAEGRLYRDDGAWRLGDLETLRAPTLVQQILDQRLERLSPEQIRLLQLAAVIGDEVPLDLWSTAAGVGDLELADVIEVASGAGILAELPDGSGFRFPQGLIRAALYNRLVLPRRLLLHRQVGELLAERPGADPDIVAYHFRTAGDARAGHWLIAAGRRAIEHFAYGMAAERFEEALRVLGEGELSSAEQGWLLCDLALAFRFDDAARGLAYLERAALLLAGIDDPALRLRVAWARLQIRSLRGDGVLPELEALAAGLEASDDVVDERMRAAGLSSGAMSYWFARFGAYAQAEHFARRQLDRYPDAASEETIRAWGGLAMAAAGRGDAGLAREAFARGRAAAAQIRDPHLTGVLLNWELMEVVLAYDADQQGARQDLVTSALEVWDRVGMPGSVPDPDEERPASDMTVFAVLLIDGEWEAAQLQAEVDLAFDGMRFDALRLLAVLAARRGDYAAARGYLNRALPRGPATEPSNFYFYSTLWLLRTGADIALAEGDAGGALAWVDAHDRWLEWSSRVLDAAPNRVLRARLHEARGNLEAALRLAREARVLAAAPRQPLALLEAERYLGHLALLSGDLPAATRHLDAALEIATACAAPYELAGVQIERVRLLHRAGRPEEAAEILDGVREIATRLEVGPYLDALDELESGAEVETAKAPGGLSPREVEVLQLVARGMTDADVGAALYISPRTVSRHLRSIYNKLGVNSRTAASAFAYQHGLIAPDSDARNPV